MKIIEKKDCMGCYACFNICPQNAITMQEDEKGFKYPIIDKEKCIKCGLCKKVCPVINQTIIKNTPQAYAIINKDNYVRETSSSGGCFSLIAEYIIENGGVVFGATFDENWRVKHTWIENIEKIKMFRGSKYLQSTIGDTYKRAKEFLDKGRKVLFTGTPCQIEGLKSYLRKDYDNLYTQDIICHGVPSPKVHDKYLEYQKNKFNAKKIKRIEHRNKENGWKEYNVKIEFDNAIYKEEHNKDLFIQAFLRDTILRDSCYNCHFKKENRMSDITLADFWGIEQVKSSMNDNKGTSLVILNSKKGNEMFDAIKDKIKFEKVNFEDAIKYNPSMIKSANMDKKREEFFKNLNNMRFDKLVQKYTYTPNIFKRITRKFKNIIIKSIKLQKTQ